MVARCLVVAKDERGAADLSDDEIEIAIAIEIGVDGSAPDDGLRKGAQLPDG